MPPPALPAWDEPSLLAVCGQAAALAARLAGGFAGVAWLTEREGMPGEWLVPAAAPPLWRPSGAAEPHPWLQHEPLLRLPIPGANALTLVARCDACLDVLQEVAVLLSAGSLTSTAPRLRQIFESTRDGVFLVDREWRIVYINHQGAKLLYSTPAALTGAILWERFPEAVGSRFQQIYERIFATGNSESFEEYFPPMDIWFQVDAFISGEELCVFYRNINQQVAEREHLLRMEAELRLALNRLRRVADESQDLICTWSADGRFERVNSASLRILGYQPAQLQGQPFLDFVAEEDRAASIEITRRILDGERVGNFQNRMLAADGRVVHVAWSSVWIGEDSVGFAIGRDISDQMAAAERLRESEQRYRLIFDEHPACMWIYDDETHRMLAANQAALDGYGYSREEFLNLTILDLVHPDEVEIARHRLLVERTPGPRVGVWLHRRKDGEPVVVQGWSMPMTMDGRRVRLGVAIDVTRERQLEDQLRQAQKMEAVGELAGGIAHDFNNLLTVINGYAEMGRKAASGTPLESMLRSIEQAGARAALLTRQLLAFSRRQVLQPQVLDLNDLIRSMEPMLRRVPAESVDFVLDLDPSLTPIRADAGQLEQVLLNLVVNARDALEGRAGRIAVETFNVTLDEEYAATHPGVAPGPYVLLTVTDSGHGMDQATAGRIFEPFFTTKTRGRGTGLGLPMAYGIVKQSGGHIGVYSEPGVGTTMKVYLPAAQGAAPDAAPAPQSASHVLPGGSETILLIEDDERVREFTAMVLRPLGYRLIEAADGHAALDAASAEPGEIHLLLTDVVLPRLSGREVAQRLAPRRPAMRALFVSGYTENAIVHHGVLDAGLNFLPKPFSPESLARKVREVLDQPLRPRCVLIAGGTPEWRTHCLDQLRQAGYVAILAANAADCLRNTRRRAVDLVLSPLDLPGHSAAESLAFFRKEFPHIRVAAPGPSAAAADFIADPASLAASIRAQIG